MIAFSVVDLPTPLRPITHADPAGFDVKRDVPKNVAFAVVDVDLL